MDHRNDTVPSAAGGGRRNNDVSKARNDLIFIGVLLMLVGAVALGFLLFQEEGEQVVVLVDGERAGVYPLSENVEVEIRTGKDGEQRNRLIIRDGEALIDMATCPDGICAAHRPISHEGESIVCLPHRVVVTVEKNRE